MEVGLFRRSQQKLDRHLAARPNAVASHADGGPVVGRFGVGCVVVDLGPIDPRSNAIEHLDDGLVGLELDRVTGRHILGRGRLVVHSVDLECVRKRHCLSLSVLRCVFRRELVPR